MLGRKHTKNISKIQGLQRHAVLLRLIAVLEENRNKMISWEISSNLLNLRDYFACSTSKLLPQITLCRYHKQNV